MEIKTEVNNENVNDFDGFMDLRAEAINTMDKLIENAFKQFMDKVGLKDIFAYKYNYDENKFTIYTSRPGFWIGYRGKNIEILKDILSKQIKEGCDVDFREIRGQFIAVTDTL